MRINPEKTKVYETVIRWQKESRKDQLNNKIHNNAIKKSKKKQSPNESHKYLFSYLDTDTGRNIIIKCHEHTERTEYCRRMDDRV